MDHIPTIALVVLAITVIAGLTALAVAMFRESRRGHLGTMRLQQFRRPTKAVADLLQYAALVDSGIVLLKSGALLGGFYYRGRDLSSSTVDERNYITGRLNAALSRFGSGWVTWQDAIRVPAPGYPSPHRSAFPDPVTRLIDEERRSTFTAEGAHFESEYALIVMWMPPERRHSKMAEMVYDDDGRAGDANDIGSKLIDQFKAALTDLEDYLGDVLRLRRMRSFDVDVGSKKVMRDDLVTYLHYCITGHVQPINVPSSPAHLDAYIGGEELWGGDTPKIGKRFVGVVSLEGLPHETSPNMLDALDHLPIAYRWSTRFVYLDQHEASAQLHRYRRKWKQKQRGFFAQVFKTQGSINEDAVAMTRTAEDAIADASSGLVTFGFYTPVIIVFSESRPELEEHCRLIAREVRRLGFASRIETVNTMEAWLGSLPGHPEPNIRRPVIHSLNLADLLPLASVWPGQAECPCVYYPPHSPPLLLGATTGATPFRLNLHVGDVGHTLILGPTGSGKSTLLALIAAQFRRYPGSTLNVFDKGRSILPLTLAVGGRHYNIASDNDRTGFAPLQFLDTDSDAAWAEEWLAMLYELQSGAAASPRQKEELHRAIALMRASRHGRSLTDFLATVQDEALRSALTPYTISGQLGQLHDAESDGLASNTMQVFELEELMNMGEKNLIPVLLYLFRRIERSLTGQPSMLVLDEAWIMLGHPVFREKIREWLKTLRRANCTVVMATQQVSDAARSGIFDVLVESCPTKILLPNEEADVRGTETHPGPRDLYAAMGLNETEIGILKSAVKKRQYYYTSTEGRRLFELSLGPVALSFVGVSDRDQLRRVMHLVQQHGDAWPFVWLEERGVDYVHYIENARPAKAA